MEEVQGPAERLEMRGVFEDVSPGDLYSWWTEGALLARFWAPQAETDPHVGGVYRLTWPDQEWTLRGTYEVCDPGRLLEFTWRWDHEPSAPVRTVRMRFAAAGDDTELTIVHEPYGPHETEERAGHLAGWTHFCDRLREVLAERG